MKRLHNSPNVNLHDVFNTFACLQRYPNMFQKYFILVIDSNGNRKKVTCNFPGLIKFIQGHAFESAYIFGISDDIKVLLIEQDEFGVKFY